MATFQYSIGDAHPRPWAVHAVAPRIDFQYSIGDAEELEDLADLYDYAFQYSIGDANYCDCDVLHCGGHKPFNTPLEMPTAIHLRGR